ncbi:hypothetical protein DPEC_G00059850 [Dallia pectoralis]|uniref:Uncharacterized protein n=1 Tax=Dallia pectoralis TaxID=75939 RepID=A0ACC2H761_DALPE|nr:hypothetical protein DPEC_G00059850 [Dallia pectoralis]
MFSTPRHLLLVWEHLPDALLFSWSSQPWQSTPVAAAATTAKAAYSVKDCCICFCLM